MANENRPNEDIIIVGDRVDLVARMGQVYRAMVEDRIENGPFLLGIPSRKGVPMMVEQDDDIYLVFYRDSGRYIAQMKVIALEQRGKIRYMWLLQKTMAQKNQRREAFRLPVSFEVRIYEYEEDIERDLAYITDEVEVVALEAVSSRDISVTGIALITGREYELDDNYILGMHLDKPLAGEKKKSTESVGALHLTATVKRCIPLRTSSKFNTGMQFFGMTRNISESIARYVLTEQQKQIKKRRLI